LASLACRNKKGSKNTLDFCLRTQKKGLKRGAQLILFRLRRNKEKIFLKKSNKIGIIKI